MTLSITIRSTKIILTTLGAVYELSKTTNYKFKNMLSIKAVAHIALMVL